MSDLDVTLLGGVSVRDGSGAAIDIGPAKCQAVLVALAVAPGAAVSVSSIVERVWGAAPPRTAEKTLQSYVVRLRRALGSDALTRVGVAYRLELSPERTDVGRFRAFVAAGDCGRALEEWGGVPFEGLDLEGLMPLVAALTEEWFAVVEADLDERVGTDPQSTLVSLTELTLRYPLRERLWALLMTALYRVGRQADALRAFQEARAVLVAELGVEPGPELRELEAAILAQSLSLGMRPGLGDVPRGTVTFAFVIGQLDAVSESARESGPYPFRSPPGVQGLAFHRASEAVAWSLATQRQASDVGVGLQIGMHSGEPELTRHGYFGPAVNIASQLATAAAPGSTLATAVTALLAGTTDAVDLGLRSLDAVTGPQRVVRLDERPKSNGDPWTPPSGNLPMRPQRLVGRDTEIAAVVGLLGTPAVTTLVGPGGIGKTSLALAVAHRERAHSNRACWYVEFATINTPQEIPAAVAHALGINDPAGTTLTDAVVGFLQASSGLLVVDNCEHVVAGAAEFLSKIAQHCPSVTILATSREGLGIAGEQLFVVPPLVPETEGVQLFAERAAEAALTFDPSSDVGAVSEICRRLDGVPLAIELAAARVRTLTLPEIVSRLDDHLMLLTGGRRMSVERHRTLRAAITWSHDLLSRAEQDLLASIAVFVGPFDLAATVAVASEDTPDPERVDELLARLVERSMVLVEPGSFSRRFRLLETVRQFASEKLHERGDAAAAARRHADWCRGQVAEIRAELCGLSEALGAARLDELWSNLRAAVEWSFQDGDHALTWELIGPLGPEIALRRRNELGAWFERLVAADPGLGDDVIAASLFFVANHRMLSLAPDHYEDLVTTHGEPDHPLARLGRALLYDNDGAILEHAGLAAEAARAAGDDVLAKMVDTARLSAHFTLRPSDEFDPTASRFLDEIRREGPPTLLQWTLFVHGHAAEIRGQHAEAAQFFDEASRIDVPAGTLSMSPSIDARRATRAGDTRQALTILRTHLADLMESDTPGLARVVAVSFVDLLDSLSRHDEAAPIRRFLQTSAGDFGAHAARSILDQPTRPSADTTQPNVGEDLDDRSAVQYMAATVQRVTGELDQ